MNTDIFTQKLDTFLVMKSNIEWELEKEDYDFLIEHHQKVLLLITISNIFSLIHNFSSIIETTQITVNQIITEVGLSCQDSLIENIEKDFI
jgi:hypothetical protein